MNLVAGRKVPNGRAVDRMMGSRDVATRSRQAMRTENRIRTAILEGADPQEAYLKFG